MILLRTHSLYLALILAVLSACKNPYGEQGSAALKFGANNTPSIDTPSSATVTVDQTDDDNSSTGFGGGMHRGTAFIDDELTLNATTNYAELDESWTPKWGNLISYWKMDGDFQDSVGTNHGAPQGNATTTTTSKVGSHAGLFDGAADYTQTPNINLGSNFTISFWIQPDNLHNYGDPVSAGITDGHLTFVTYADGHMFYAIGNGSWANSVLLPPGYLENGKWYYIVGTYDGSDIKLYANGSFIGSAPVASVSINQIISIGSRISMSYDYEGKVDDIAIWNKALTTNEVSIIYSRQSAKYSGEMKSRIIDSKETNSSWSNLDWLTTLPFGKELPDGGGVANSEISTNYTSLSSSSLMDGITGLWHMNETNWDGTVGEVKDTSGLEHHGTSENTLVTIDGCRFSRCANFKKSLNQYISLPSSDRFISNSNQQITISAWINARSVTTLGPSAQGQNRVITLHRGAVAGSSFTIGLSDSNRISYYNNAVGSYTYWDKTIALNEWYHLAVTYNGTCMQRYINGILDGGCVDQGLAKGGTYPAQIGAYANERFFDGKIDEVGIWSRPLSSDEILQLYRRGANRIKYQVRTCANSDCSDKDPLAGNGWKGPGGNYLTYFSELHNNSYVISNCSFPQECFASELSLDGDVQTEAPSIYFNQFGADGVSVDNNRYFQYRLIMESDDESAACDSGTKTCMPELKSVKAGPSHTYEQ